jgi:hypothetical protein
VVERSRRDSIWDRIVAQIPGFGGYADAQRRRESDDRTRQWVVQQLQVAAADLDLAIKRSVSQGDLGAVGEWEAVRQQLALLASRMRISLRPGEGIFTSARLDDDTLQDLYDLEADLLDDAAAIARRVADAGQMADPGPSGSSDASTANSLPAAPTPQELRGLLNRLEAAVTRRQEMLAGKASP